MTMKEINNALDLLEEEVSLKDIILVTNLRKATNHLSNNHICCLNSIRLSSIERSIKNLKNDYSL